jgi:hypothetical protein
MLHIQQPPADALRFWRWLLHPQQDEMRLGRRCAGKIPREHAFSKFKSIPWHDLRRR